MYQCLHSVINAEQWPNHRHSMSSFPLWSSDWFNDFRKIALVSLSLRATINMNKIFERTHAADDNIMFLAVACVVSIHWLDFLLLCNKRFTSSHSQQHTIRDICICICISNARGFFYDYRLRIYMMFVGCLVSNFTHTHVILLAVRTNKIAAYHWMPIRIGLLYDPVTVCKCHFYMDKGIK